MWLEFEGDEISSFSAQTESDLARRWRSRQENGYHKATRERARVQTFGIKATNRSGTVRASCGENSIPDFGRPVVLDAKLSEFELTFPDSVHQFNAGDGN